jgi:hypothetical protein
MDYDEPHLASNEKTQPIQWIEWPTGAMAVIGSLWLVQKTPMFQKTLSLTLVTL